MKGLFGAIFKLGQLVGGARARQERVREISTIELAAGSRCGLICAVRLFHREACVGHEPARVAGEPSHSQKAWPRLSSLGLANLDECTNATRLDWSYSLGPSCSTVCASGLNIHGD